MRWRICAVSFVDVRGIRHTAEVQAESLYEAAILGVRTFKSDPWIEQLGTATVLDIEVREPAAKHAITMHGKVTVLFHPDREHRPVGSCRRWG